MTEPSLPIQSNGPLNPARLSAPVSDLARESVLIALGRSRIAPATDRRFADPAWSGHPVYRRIGQQYLAFCHAVDAVLADRELARGPMDRTRFVADVLTSALAPTNVLAGNPAAVKKAFDTAGLSLLRGTRNLVHDVRHNGAMPATAKPGVLRVGQHLALTPGAVIERDPVAELLEYAPTTSHVAQLPLLIVPPPIGRFYFLDLQPGRSFVEYAVSRGLRTHLLSWRNPTKAERAWNLDTYAARILRAIDTIRETTGNDQVNVLGFCAGGLISTTVLNHLAHTGQQHKVASMAFAVTLLDFDLPAPIRAFSATKLLALTRAKTRRAGLISAHDMGSAFAWMRPNDLVWNYWVNNYLLGQDPPVFDILSWNADGTNLPAALHEQFLDCFEHNVLARGHLTVLGTPVDLATITIPTFVAGAINDHLTPWRGTYRTTGLLSGPTTFVLSNAGHIQALVNPPDNPKASYYTGDALTPDPDTWLAGATEHSGSWWQPWAEWTLNRSGDQIPAPTDYGNHQHPATDPAPGRYVHQ